MLAEILEAVLLVTVVVVVTIAVAAVHPAITNLIRIVIVNIKTRRETKIKYQNKKTKQHPAYRIT